MAKRVAVYCRVSTKEEMQLNSLKAQKEYYAKTAMLLGYELVGIYADISSGLQTKKRLQFETLLKDCRKNKVDIITKSIVRFARSTVDFLSVIRELKELRVDIYFENEKILLGQERSELRMTILAVVAQEESLSKKYQMGIELQF